MKVMRIMRPVSQRGREGEKEREWGKEVKKSGINAKSLQCLRLGRGRAVNKEA